MSDTQIYKVRDPSGTIREIHGPAGASDDEVIAQAKALFSAPAAPTNPVDQIPGYGKPVPAGQGSAAPAQPDTLLQKGLGLFEAPLALGAGAAMGAVAPIVGVGATLASGKYGTQEGIRAGEQAAQRIQGMAYQPRTQTGQNIVQGIGNALNASGIQGVPMPLMNDLARSVGPAARAIGDAARNEGGMIRQSASPVINPVMNVVGSAADVANRVRRKAADVSTGVAAGASSLLTGKPSATFKEAYRAGKTGDQKFIDNMRGRVGADEMLADVKEGLSNIQAANSEAYKTAKVGWAADKTPLNFEPIDAAYTKLKSSLQEGGRMKIGPAEQNIVRQIGDVIDEWRKDPTARTTLDFDALKQRLDAIYPESPAHRQAQRAVTEISNAVKKTITDQAPDYANAMKEYSTQLELMRDINKALGAGDKVSKDAAINKIMSVVKSQPSSKFKQGLVEQLKTQGGVDVMPAIAGQALSSWEPSGLGRMNAIGAGSAAFLIHHPELLAIAPLTIPRLMGETFRGVGKMSGAGGRTLDRINMLAPNVQMTPDQMMQLNMLLQQSQGSRNQNALTQ